MPMYIRPRSNGKAYELRVTHKHLDKPRYATRDTQEQAEALGNRTLAALERGEMPQWLTAPERAKCSTVRGLVREYISQGRIAASTLDVLATITVQIGDLELTQINVQWAEGWIRSLKIDKRLSPGTIRKRKGALARVFHWAVDNRPLSLARNPLDRLQRGYSGYSDQDVTGLAAQSLDSPEDSERMRRIDADEQQRILSVLQQRLKSAQTLEQRAEVEGLQLMLELALQTAMRMKEIYTLTMDQVRVDQQTIFLERSKNGDKRQVPLNDEACEILSRRWPALEESRNGKQLLPFWEGERSKNVFKKTTGTVSRLFAALFKEAGSIDLHFHDTRHEAVCRWVLFTPISSEQLGRWAGMRDARTRMRYLSLRGSEGARVLNQRRDGAAVSPKPADQ